MVTILLDQGKAAEALALARATVAFEQDPRNTSGLFNGLDEMWYYIGVTEAQLGRRPAAEEAIQESRRLAALWLKNKQLPEFMRPLVPEWQLAMESEVHLIFGEYEPAYTDAYASAGRIQKIPGDAAASTKEKDIAYREVMRLAAMAALRLGHAADAEAAARALVDDSLKGVAPDRVNYVADWNRVLLAHALALQGRRADANPVLEPALTRYRDQLGKVVTSVGFLQRVARAITGSGSQPANKATASVEFSYRAAYAFYVQALLQADDAAGRTARRDLLEEAAKTLQGIPEESKQLHEWKELNDWIFKARQRPGK